MVRGPGHEGQRPTGAASHREVAQRQADGRVADRRVDPREPFLQSYRAELAHFVAVLRGDAAYEAPDDQVLVYKTMELIYKAAEDGKEIRP